MRFETRIYRPTVLVCAMLALAPVTVSRADVVVTIDAGTLNDVLSEIARQEVSVPLSPTESLTLRVGDLKITGFEPTRDELKKGLILTSMKLEVAELGSTLEVQPGISLDVTTERGAAELELRFQQLMLRLPLMRPINVAGLLPPMRFPADNLFLLSGSQGDVRVNSRLRSVRIQENGIRFDFGIEVRPEP